MMLTDHGLAPFNLTAMDLYGSPLQDKRLFGLLELGSVKGSILTLGAIGSTLKVPCTRICLLRARIARTDLPKPVTID